MTDTTRREVLGWLAGLGAAAGAGLLLPGQAGASTNVIALRDVTLIDSSGVRSKATIVAQRVTADPILTGDRWVMVGTSK